MSLNFIDNFSFSLSGDTGMGMHYGAHPLIFRKAEELRNRMTHAEELLWNYLKNLMGLLFVLYQRFSAIH